MDGVQIYCILLQGAMWHKLKSAAFFKTLYCKLYFEILKLYFEGVTSTESFTCKEIWFSIEKMASVYIAYRSIHFSLMSV